MGWQDAAAKHFPDIYAADTPPRASVPSVPTSRQFDELGTVGTLARHTVSDKAQHDAHICDWCAWLERAAIIEHDGGKSRYEANRAALVLIKGGKCGPYHGK